MRPMVFELCDVERRRRRRRKKKKEKKEEEEERRVTKLKISCLFFSAFVWGSYRQGFLSVTVSSHFAVVFSELLLLCNTAV